MSCQRLTELCFFLSWQLLTDGVGMWQRRSLLLKLSGQTQLLEELAEISVDRLGAITSAADGRNQPSYHSCTLEQSVYVLLLKCCIKKTCNTKPKWLGLFCSVWPCVVSSQSSRASQSAPSWWLCGRSAAGLQDFSTQHWTECSNTWTSATRQCCRRGTHTVPTQVG